ncbi:MAG: radical SAM protein [Nitrospinae bacterium]|nr:radical SAM protein [Nitrospinota bacterium]
MITSRCTLKCSMCAHSGPDGEDFPISAVKGMALQLAELGVKVVYVTGGEPFARKDLRAVVAPMLEEGLEIRLSTNATTVTAKRAEELEGIQDISVSIDGNERVHDRIRGVKGAWKRAVEGIKRIRESQPSSRVSLSFTLMPANMDEINAVFELAETLGVHSVGVQPWAPAFGGAKTWQRNAGQFAKMASTLKNLARLNHPLNCNGAEYYQAAADYVEKGFRRHGKCKAGGRIFTLFPNGGVSPCWAFAATANAIEDGLNKAIQSRGFEAASSGAGEGQCPGCMFYCYYQ